MCVIKLLGTLLFLAIAFWIRHAIQYRRRNPEGLPLPPGPSGLPLVGNILNFPKREAWLMAAEWRRKYGNLVFMQVFGNPIVFVDSYNIAMELLDKRSSIYSNRPRVAMMNELMGLDWTITIMPYGPRLRKQRAFLHQYLQPSAIKQHHHILKLETHRLITSLFDSPENYAFHIRRTTAAIIMMIAYGHKIAPEGDIYVKLADQVLESFSIAGEPGAFLVDFFPALKYVPAWFPGAKFKRKAKVWYKQSQAMLKVPYAMTKRRIIDGTARFSILTDLIERNTDKDGHIDSEDDIAACAAVTYAGGSDTTVSAITSFLLALVLYPEVQTRGQEELDRVIGRDRLPTFEDRHALPYIDGIVKETLRWNPVVPGGGMHASEEDDMYNGYFIPAGTIIAPNQWAMLHDESEYPEPSAFLPERWILKEGEKQPRDPTKVAFGFGRRICPGKDLAEESIYIAIVTILATLTVKKAIDVHGQPITPPGNYRTGLLCHPEPFECSIAPRSPEIVAIVRQAIQDEE